MKLMEILKEAQAIESSLTEAASKAGMRKAGNERKKIDFAEARKIMKKLSDGSTKSDEKPMLAARGIVISAYVAGRAIKPADLKSATVDGKKVAITADDLKTFIDTLDAAHKGQLSKKGGAKMKKVIASIEAL